MNMTKLKSVFLIAALAYSTPLFLSTPQDAEQDPVEQKTNPPEEVSFWQPDYKGLFTSEDLRYFLASFSANLTKSILLQHAGRFSLDATACKKGLSAAIKDFVAPDEFNFFFPAPFFQEEGLMALFLRSFVLANLCSCKLPENAWIKFLASPVFKMFVGRLLKWDEYQGLAGEIMMPIVRPKSPKLDLFSYFFVVQIWSFFKPRGLSADQRKYWPIIAASAWLNLSLVNKFLDIVFAKLAAKDLACKKKRLSHTDFISRSKSKKTL